MITQELISYIRSEVNKGKTREDIRKALLSGGGWSEVDISEAFRDVMPLEVIKNTPVPSLVFAPSPVVNTPLVAPSPVAPKSVLSPIPTPVYKPTNINSLAKVAPAHPMDTSTFRPAASNLYSQPKKTHHFKGLLMFLFIVFLVVGGGFFFKDEVLEFFSSFKEGVVSLIDKNETNLPPAPPVIPSPIAQIPPTPERVLPTSPINCGETVAPDPNNPSIYQNDPVLNCLGASAMSCQWAQATLASPLYPSKVEIITSSDLPSGECAFRIAYPLDSKLISVTGKVMAGESIACPLNIVKSFTEDSKGVSIFAAPSKNNSSTYGAEIYFYATAGVFIEHNLDKKQIEFAGCNGRFIDFVIDSYNVMKQEQ